MTTGKIPVLRGRLAHIFSDDDRAISVLTRQMDLIGVRHRVNPTVRDAEVGVQWVDMDVLMAPERNHPGQAPGLSLQIPIIAMLGTQSPGCIERMLAFDPCMVISKPVPAQGVFMAMSVALHEAGRRDRDLMRILDLEERLRGLPLVIAAVSVVMSRQGCDESEALARLREDARVRRISLETVAAEFAAQRCNAQQSILSRAKGGH